MRNIKWKVAQFLEIRWWKRYLKKQKKAEYYQKKKEYWLSYLSKLELNYEEIKNERILDAGCGPAGIFIAFDGADITAVDPLLEHYEEHLTHFSKADFPKTTFVKSGVEDYFSQQKFTYTFCLNVINHVSDIKAAVDALVENTTTGGKVTISVDCHRNGLLKKIFQFLGFDALHPYQYSPQDYIKLFTSNNTLNL
ncbi:MAG: methyltransferase domain-containing protein [Bacteroidota bacterium]|nr:methyltransferase domain-containing protein [Bacteroidota bacterium]